METIKTASEMWQEFVKEAIPLPKLTEMELNLMELSFYIGFAASLTATREIAEALDLTREQKILAFEFYEKEVYKFLHKNPFPDLPTVTPTNFHSNN